MKKIGIMTPNASFLNNYGAALQAYALSAQLKEWGYEVQIINYRYDTGTQTVAAENEASKSVLDRLKYLGSGDVSLLQKVLYRLYRQKRTDMKGYFRTFCKEYLPINMNESYDIVELQSKEIGFDCLITGSDQVWNPLIHCGRNDPGYFLDFGSVDIRRIAYARVLASLSCQKDVRQR